jgi:hypothetical protein
MCGRPDTATTTSTASRHENHRCHSSDTAMLLALRRRRAGPRDGVPCTTRSGNMLNPDCEAANCWRYELRHFAPEQVKQCHVGQRSSWLGEWSGWNNGRADKTSRRARHTGSQGGQPLRETGSRDQIPIDNLSSADTGLRPEHRTGRTTTEAIIPPDGMHEADLDFLVRRAPACRRTGRNKRMTDLALGQRISVARGERC